MPGILVGYARTSTCEQQAGLDAQVRDLKAAGCEEIFSEQVSAVAQRDRLSEALRFVRRGDTLVACKPDRLARSTADLLRIVFHEARWRQGIAIEENFRQHSKQPGWWQTNAGSASTLYCPSVLQKPGCASRFFQ